MNTTRILARLVALLLLCASQPVHGARTLHCVIFRIDPFEKSWTLTRRNGRGEDPGFTAPVGTGTLYPSSLGLSKIEVAYRGRASISGEETLLLESIDARQRGERYRITVQSTGSGSADAPEFLFDIDTVTLGSIDEYWHTQVTRLKAPLTPNRWQKVCNAKTWFYLEDTDSPTGETTPPGQASGASSAPPLFQLDAVFGYLPPDTVARMESFSPRHSHLAADIISSWRSFAFLCQDGSVLQQASGGGELEKLDKKDYDNTRLAEFKGSVTISSSGLTLDSNLRFPLNPDKKPLEVSFTGPLVPGEWTLRPIADGPEMRPWGDTRHGAWCRPLGTLKANVAAYRIISIPTS